MTITHIGAPHRADKAAPVNATLPEPLLLKLATALGVTPARIRAVLDDTTGAATADYALLFAALALAVIGWLGLCELAIETLWHQTTATMQDTTGPVLCAGQHVPSPSGGSC